MVTNSVNEIKEIKESWKIIKKKKLSLAANKKDAKFAFWSWSKLFTLIIHSSNLVNQKSINDNYSTIIITRHLN